MSSDCAPISHSPTSSKSSSTRSPSRPSPSCPRPRDVSVTTLPCSTALAGPSTSLASPRRSPLPPRSGKNSCETSETCRSANLCKYYRCANLFTAPAMRFRLVTAITRGLRTANQQELIASDSSLAQVYDMKHTSLPDVGGGISFDKHHGMDLSTIFEGSVAPCQHTAITRHNSRCISTD